MAAARWVFSALRTTWRGSVYKPVIGSSCQCTQAARLAWTLETQLFVPPPVRPAVQQYRHSSFFNKLTADQLWRGVMAESGAGAKKGRGKRAKRKLRKDLNRGQQVGEGRSGFLWPGLNAPVVKSGAIQMIGQRDKALQVEKQAEIIRQRDEWDRKRRQKVKRERGWTGSSWGGISLGPPDPGLNGETYENFDSRVIEVKSVFNMTAKEGRKRSVSALVAVGNGNGAAGFALGKAADRTTAFRKAKNRAIHYLYFIERYNNHTIYHDITSTFKRTTLRMKKQNRGYGLHCHRAVITICKLIGIEDMYAKVSGSTNLLNITRALFQGLSRQETHQSLAEKKKLHVVEFREECGPLPLIVASPYGDVRKEPEPEDEIPDTKLDWNEVKAAQGMKRSIWANVKRTVW
ncbi:28S ribosomal protein S5, mitochondrial isoform X2 [Latimeria chalumnae]|uniref:28S ribosomal protein S5, mitochondrial isoform X2 n=1 Tax=Latimeria chalumnae TaxID=7897 RepID=UPI0006D93474|nr:PREDICTED: 28S ribosomal protein S5, mitochondrial [Latimeria chalumnae]|eukprot:XP_006007415.2 PREDICTED: 28S ribosomal protein S5, mitochondrial [Latimeria chalumnae]